MGDIGDYWREHKEYVASQKRGKYKPPEVEYECSCGKKYYSICDEHRMKDHMKSKGKHELVKGEFLDMKKYGSLY